MAWMGRSPVAPHSSTPAELKARLEAERAGKPFLVFRDGGGHQQLVDLADAEELTIGRRPECDIALSWELGVSRLHAQLVRIGLDWAVVDDGLSRNGTFVNGVRIEGRRRLRDGDELRFGQAVLRFCDPTQAESRVTANEEPSGIVDVTPAQQRVLVALCRPYKEPDAFSTPPSNSEIADELVVSVDAVKGHLRALFETFGLSHLPQHEKRVRLVERAFSSGVVSRREL
jgi:pSer/pThr/pTyr-binding forkhead associated (FHA) protein